MQPSATLLSLIAILAPTALAAPTPLPASISTNPLTPPQFPMCIPQISSNHCLLSWNTNTMAVNRDLSNANNFAPYARATLYSSDCHTIGAISNGLDQNVYLDAVGLESGLLMQNVWDEARGFRTPSWSYAGHTYSVDTCACFDGVLMGEPKDTHVCQCPFPCRG